MLDDEPRLAPCDLRLLPTSQRQHRKGSRC